MVGLVVGAPLNLSVMRSFSESMLFVVVEDAPGSCCVTLVCPSGPEVTTVVVVADFGVSIARMGCQRFKNSLVVVVVTVCP